jgi:5'-nucleotidase/UDP-sugar diphosphatase
MTESRHSRRAAAILALLALAALVACAAPRPVPLVVLHTNDVHAHLAREGGSLGAAEVAGAIAEERRRAGDVLVLDAGDLVTGTPISSLTRGRAPFAVAGRMGYDAMALGNHELDHGWRMVAEYRRIAPYPILCANAFAPDGSLLADAASAVLDLGDLRVAVVGVLAEDALDQTVREGNEGVVVTPPADALRALVPTLREQADLVIVLSHCGLETDRRLAREVPGIAAIVGGHSHDELEEPRVENGVPIVQAGHDLRALGRLELLVDRREKRVLDARGALLRPGGPVDPVVAGAVRDLEGGLGARLDRRIGRTDRAISEEEIRELVERVFRERLGAELGFHNPGGVRASLPAGAITVRGVWQALPFENTIVVVRLRGADLPEELRARLGDALEPDRVYSVATNSFVAQQQAQFFGRTGVPVEDSGLSMRDAVIEAIEAAGGIPGP